MPGPPPKPGERRQRRNRPPLQLVAPMRRALTPADVPPPPAHWLRRIRDDWAAFWVSPLALAVEPVTDLPAVERLFSLRDERERAYRTFRKHRLVKGSQKQWVLNPIARMVPVWDAEIRQLEDRFGLSARSRLQLGITARTFADSLEGMNKELDEDPDDRSSVEEDPRLRSIGRRPSA